jgi:hypothetical protein
MAYHAEAAGFGLHAGFKRVAVDQSARNEVEHLFEDDHIGPDWCCFFITPYRVEGISTQHQPAFPLSAQPSRGTAVLLIDCRAPGMVSNPIDSGHESGFMRCDDLWLVFRE